MPCLECQHRDSIIAQLQAALEERNSQLSEANAKLTKQKLQSKAKWAQLKHQILENVAEKEGESSQKIVDNLLSKLDDAENQLSQCRDELDTLKSTLAVKESELRNQTEAVAVLEEKVRHLESDQSTSERRTGAGSEEEDMDEDELREQMRQMYAQIVYKDSKIVDLNEMILHRDQKILDLQESCRERDEVIWAKSKAIQVFQDKLNFYANREFRDVATETAGYVPTDPESDSVAGPGRAVAFYRPDDKTTRMEEDESSVTTEVKVDAASAILGKFTELADAVRRELEVAPVSSASSLNQTLSDLLQQTDVLQNKLATAESSQRSHQAPSEPRKKKREKRVTFDFTQEQEHAQELAAITEKLRQAEQACFDLREENDDLRITIGDLERQIDSNGSHFSDLERYVETEQQLSEALETIKELKNELSAKEDDRSESERIESQIHQLEEERDQWKEKYLDAESKHANVIEELQNGLYEIESENVKLIKQKETILSDVDDLREAIETSQQLVIELESDLQSSNSELDEIRSSIEIQRREHADTVATLERELRNQKLNSKAYETKLRSVERENERLSELLEAQKEEWKSLRAEEKEVTGFRLKAKAYEAKLRILRDDNERLENLVSDLKSMVDTANGEKAELTREYESKLTEFEQEAKENLILIDRVMAEQKVEIAALKTELSSEARLKRKAYEAKLRSVERENERLVDQIEELKSINERMEEEKKQYLEESNRYREKIRDETEKQQNLHELKDALEKSEKRESDLKVNLEKLKSELNSKEAECNSLMESIAESQLTVKSLHSQLDSSKNSQQQLKEENHLLNVEKQDLEADLHRLWDVETNLKKRVGELEILNGHLQEETESLRLLCASADANDQKLFDLTAAHQALIQNHTKLKEKMEYLEAEKTQLEEDLNLSRQREVDLKEDKAQLEKRLNEMEDQHSSTMQELTELKTTVKTAMEETENLKREVEDARRRFDELRGSFEASSDQEKQSLMNEISQLKVTKADLEEQLSSAEQINQELIQIRVDNSALQENLTASVVEAKDLQDRIASLQEEKRLLESDAMRWRRAEDQMQISLEEGNVELENWQEELERLQRELMDIKTTHDAKVKECEYLQDQLRSLEGSTNEKLSMMNEEMKRRDVVLAEKVENQVRLENIVDENERLKRSVEEATIEREKLAEERQSLCKEIVELNEKLSMTDELSQALKQEVENLVEENENMKSILDSNKDDDKGEIIARLEKQNQDIQASHDQLLAYYTQLQSAYATVCGHLEQTRVKPLMKNVETEIDGLVDGGGSGRMDASVNTEESGGQREGTPDQARSDTIKIKAKLRKMGKTLEALEAKNRYLQEQNSSLSGTVSELEEQLSSIKHGQLSMESKVSVETQFTSDSEPVSSATAISSEVKDGTNQPQLQQLDSEKVTVQQDDETEKKIAAAMAEARGFEQHVAVLIEQLNSCKSTNSSLQDHVEKLELERSRLKDKLADVNETMELLKQELAVVKQLCQSMDTEKQMLQQRVRELSAQEIELKRNIWERTDALASMQSSVSESQAAVRLEMDELRENYESVKDQLDNAVSERDRVQETVRRMLATNDELEITNHSLMEKIEQLENRQADVESVRAIREENSQMKSKMQDLLSTLQTWESRVSGMETTIQELSKENEEITKQRKDAENNLEKLKIALTAAQREATQANEDSNLLRCVLEELESKNGELQDEINSLSAKCQQLEPLEDIVTYHKELEQRFHEELEKREMLETQLGEVNEEWKKSKENEVKLMENVSRLQEEYEKLKMEIETISTGKVSETVATSTDLGMNDLDLVQKELESAVRRFMVENEQLNMERQDLEKRVEILQSEASEDAKIRSAMEELQSKNEELLEENRRVSEKCTELETAGLETEMGLEEMKTEKCGLLEQLESLMAMKTELEIRLEETKKANAELLKNMKSVEKSKGNLEIQLEEMMKENALILDKLEIVERSKSEQDTAKEEMESLKEELHRAGVRYSELEVDSKRTEDVLKIANEEMAKAKSDLDVVRGLYENLYMAYGQLETTNRELIKEMEKSRNELLVKVSNEKTLSVALEESKVENGELSSQLKTIKDENAAHKEEMDRQRKEFDRKIKEMEKQADEANVSWAKECRDLELRVMAKKKENDELESAIQRLRAELAENDDSIKDLNMRNDRINVNLEEKQGQIRNLEMTLKSSSEKLVQFETAFTKLGVNADNVNDVMEFLEGLLRERDSYNRERLELRSRVEAVQVQAENAVSEREKAKSIALVNEKLTNEIERLNGRLNDMVRTHENEIIKVQQSTVETWQPYLLGILSELNSWGGENFEENLKRLGSKAVEFERSSCSLAKELKSWKEKCNRLETNQQLTSQKWANLEQQIIAYTQKCGDMEKEISEKTSRCVALEEQISGANEKLGVMEEECKRLREQATELDNVKGQLNSTESLIHEKVTECSVLKARLEKLQQTETMDEEVHKELDDTREYLAKARSDLAAQNEEMTEWKQQIERLSGENSRLHEALRKYDVEHGQLKQRMEEISSEKEDLEKSMREKNSQISHVEQQMENQQIEWQNLLERWELQNGENEEMKEQMKVANTEIISLKSQIEDQRELVGTLEQKDTECAQLHGRLTNVMEELRRCQLEFDERQRGAVETSISQISASKDMEFQQEMARFQNQFAIEIACLQEDIGKCQREKTDALQWLEQERPKYVSAIRNLGEAKERLTQQERQLESAYLKLAELDVTKEHVRELEREQDTLRTERKEMMGKCDQMRREMEELGRQLETERNEWELLRRQKEENTRQNAVSPMQSGNTIVDDAGQRQLLDIQTENERLRAELKVSEMKNAHLIAQFRDLEYHDKQWKRRSPQADTFVDMETGSEHGDTISLMPVSSMSDRGRDTELSLQLRRETLGSLAATDRAPFKSARLWLKSKFRKYPYLGRRRPSVSKLLVAVYLLTIHAYLFVCLLH